MMAPIFTIYFIGIIIAFIITIALVIAIFEMNKNIKAIKEHIVGNKSYPSEDWIYENEKKKEPKEDWIYK